jgi:sugar phosphate isomerase/epimerase
MTNGISRRQFVTRTAAAMAYAGSIRAGAPLSKMGIASTSFMGAEIGSGPPAPAPGTNPAARFRGRDAFQFLEKCYALGAGGVQTQLNGDIAKLRARAEELGMYLEGMVSIPRNGDPAPLEKSLADAKAAGATVVRAAMLSGRRYETFKTLAEWKQWVEQSHTAIKAAMPVIEKHKVVVALENHKDWTLDEFRVLLKTYESEYLQVCLDFGNNIALLDDPMELVEGLAPYAKSTHIKDMDVRPYQDGFLLSEVPLGTGLLDLPKIVATLQKANPAVKFSLEMITRDPLKVPCMTETFWNVFPDRHGRFLAQTFRLVRGRAGGGALPTVAQIPPEERVRIEEENVKACLRHVNDKKLIA